MALNLNEKVFVLPTLQAAGADVSLANGSLAITGAEPIPVRNIQTAQLVSTTPGVGNVNTITLTTTIAANTTYSGVVQQVIPGYTYNFPFTYTTGATAPSSGDFYLALLGIFQAGTASGAILGTATGGSTNVVFTSSPLAPVAAFVLNNLSVSTAATVLVAAGSACTNAAPRVLSTAAAHGLTIGGIYSISFSGVGTSPGNANLNGRTLYGIVTSATDITLLGTAATGAVVTTSATMTVSNLATETFFSQAGRMTGYSASNSYVGLLATYVSEAAVESGIVIPQLILADATNNSVANVNAYVNALIAALDGSNAAEMVAAL
jgi:hypothetical protein